MSISASELGMAFVKVCFSLFQGEGHFLYLAAACFICLLILKKESWKSFWGLYGAFLLLIVFNPLIWRVVDLLGMDDEYYRFLWLIPMTPLMAYTLTIIIKKLQKRTLQLVALFGAIGVIIFTGQSIFSRSWETIENIYKIPDEVIEICEIIRADSDKDQPVVASDFDLSVLINQYAPEIDLILSYREIAGIQELRDLGDENDGPTCRLMHVIIDEKDHDEGYFKSALLYGGVDYVVIERGHNARDYIGRSQCKLIAELNQYCIFRVELK